VFVGKLLILQLDSRNNGNGSDKAKGRSKENRRKITYFETWIFKKVVKGLGLSSGGRRVRGSDEGKGGGKGEP
jgi:hypothetical protein